ncbi:MAG: alpha/beta hydrolase [Candidatus Aminicenantes bacterium]|nr:MAG: alpha/beta hydrolase [Candidatus Aminicenantes bacterium]
MRFHSLAVLIVMLVCLAAAACQKKAQDTSAKKRESILDRVVVIEPELITEIPKVSRWCDRLDLVKQRINVGDAELYVEEEGKGTPLVLINGGPGGTHHYFHPWFSRAKDYARVLYYDQRGCGLSDFKPGENGYSVEQAVSDLDALRKAKKIDKWVVLGYSYGGFLAQYYTINYPQHVAGLVLLGTSPGMWTKTGPSRQGQFLSDSERARMNEIHKQLRQLDIKKDLPRSKLIQVLLYNNFINGDWKRQHFYKPSRERMAQIALYEWDHDDNFNGILNNSMSRVDLTGAFASNPIPTLILEGKWDLTWGKKKPGILKKNHQF